MSTENMRELRRLFHALDPHDRSEWLHDLAKKDVEKQGKL